jgi:hypothetical protein
MGILLFVCISGFLILFLVNNDVSIMVSSPLAMIMVAVILVADIYLVRSLVRDWWHRES